MDKLITIMYHYVRDLKHSRYPKIKSDNYIPWRHSIRPCHSVPDQTAYIIIHSITYRMKDQFRTL